MSASQSAPKSDLQLLLRKSSASSDSSDEAETEQGLLESVLQWFRDNHIERGNPQDIYDSFVGKRTQGKLHLSLASSLLARRRIPQ